MTHRESHSDASSVRTLESMHPQPPAPIQRQMTTLLAKKSEWPFDYYEAGETVNVDYCYWTTPFRTCHGRTLLTCMVAETYLPGGAVSTADNARSTKKKKEAHRMAHGAFVKAVRKD
eukprot:Polyplicarium_translucidae@DN739_c0_g1_i1.p2